MILYFMFYSIFLRLHMVPNLNGTRKFIMKAFFPLLPKWPNSPTHTQYFLVFVSFSRAILCIFQQVRLNGFPF